MQSHAQVLNIICRTHFLYAATKGLVDVSHGGCFVEIAVAADKES